MSIGVKEIFNLSAPERIELVEALWDSISEEDANKEISLTETQLEELDRRLELYRKGEMPTYSWEEAKQMIKKNEF